MERFKLGGTTGVGQTCGAFKQCPKEKTPNQLMGDPTETNVLINGICCHSLLDTGSTVSSISESFYRHHLSDIPLQPLYGILNNECASGDSLPYIGCVEANISVPGIYHHKNTNPSTLFINPFSQIICYIWAKE